MAALDKKITQYEDVIAANRMAAKTSKYVTEFRFCIIPIKKRVLLASFAHKITKVNDKSIIVGGSTLKNIAITIYKEFFVTATDYQLTRSIIEHLIEHKVSLKAFTFQVYVISDTKVDEYNIGFTMRSIANNKLAEIIKKKKKGK